MEISVLVAAKEYVERAFETLILWWELKSTHFARSWNKLKPNIEKLFCYILFRKKNLLSQTDTEIKFFFNNFCIWP